MQPNIYGSLDLVRLVYKPEEAVPLQETFSPLLKFNGHVHARAFTKQTSSRHSLHHTSMPSRQAGGTTSQLTIDRSLYDDEQTGAVSTQSRSSAKKGTLERWNANS
jgi:hypothetical protein